MLDYSNLSFICTSVQQSVITGECNPGISNPGCSH